MNPRQLDQMWKLSPNSSNIVKFGYNGSASDTEQTIWSKTGIYPWSSLGDWNDATGCTISVVSSEASDDGTSSPLGSGAHSIQVQGLGPLGVYQSETVTLQGTTPVELTKKFTRVFRASVYTGNDADGTISISETDSSPAVVVAEIPIIAGRTINQTLMSVATVPAGYTAYIHSVLVSPSIAVSKVPNITLLVRTPNNGNTGVFRAQYTFSAQYSTPVEFPDPLRYPQGTDLEVRIKWGSATTTPVNCIVNATIIPRSDATAAQMAVINATNKLY